ncbi:hypothetical protein MTBLM5_110003 [Magnetospirillum sp. LM-5]|uniref:hypothetical protein n=1 Tax=Magnetospirillum sp. LM-5 TaxID=2681466 RepID=UPI00138020C4|nr:hypothetical protein [Magnetospirillum sp. LM-5]CAA7613249.1 hypothetical protein MTBLM5_110003 [Magnetospirillum sp. LM-5]
MFAKSLNLHQKKLLIVLAYRIMVADYKIRPEESELLNALENELGVEDLLSDEEMRTQPDLSLLDTREARVGTMLKLYAIAHSDADFHQSERVKLVDYGRLLGFDDATLDRMDRWGRQHTDLVIEAAALANEGGEVVSLDSARRVIDAI